MSVFIPIPKKGNAKECSNVRTIALISHTNEEMLKILQTRLQQYTNFQMFKLHLEKAKEPEIKFPTFVGSQKKQENYRKTSSFALLITLKPLTMKVKVKSLSRVLLFVTPWTVVHQAPPSMGFSRQEYWSRVPLPSPGGLPHPGIETRSPSLQADALLSEPQAQVQMHPVRSSCRGRTFSPPYSQIQWLRTLLAKPVKDRLTR